MLFLLMYPINDLINLTYIKYTMVLTYLFEVEIVGVKLENKHQIDYKSACDLSCELDELEIPYKAKEFEDGAFITDITGRQIRCSVR